MTLPSVFVYCDKMTDNYIEIIKENNIVYIQKHYIDPDNGKLFVVLLKEAFRDMKDKGSIMYRQYVEKYEWEIILKYVDGWRVVETSKNDTILLECDIDDASYCIMEGIMTHDTAK